MAQGSPSNSSNQLPTSADLPTLSQVNPSTVLPPSGSDARCFPSFVNRRSSLHRSASTASSFNRSIHTSSIEAVVTATHTAAAAAQAAADSAATAAASAASAAISAAAAATNAAASTADAAAAATAAANAAAQTTVAATSAATSANAAATAAGQTKVAATGATTSANAAATAAAQATVAATAAATSANASTAATAANSEAQRKNSLLMVISIAFTISLGIMLSPVGGVWEDDNKDLGRKAGTAKLSSTKPDLYGVLTMTNAVLVVCCFGACLHLNNDIYIYYLRTRGGRFSTILLVWLVFLLLYVVSVIGMFLVVTFAPYEALAGAMFAAGFAYGIFVMILRTIEFFGSTGGVG